MPRARPVRLGAASLSSRICAARLEASREPLARYGGFREDRRDHCEHVLDSRGARPVSVTSTPTTRALRADALGWPPASSRRASSRGRPRGRPRFRMRCSRACCSSSSLYAARERIALALRLLVANRSLGGRTACHGRLPCVAGRSTAGLLGRGGRAHGRTRPLFVAGHRHRGPAAGSCPRRPG